MTIKQNLVCFKIFITQHFEYFKIYIFRFEGNTENIEN